jgi:hypothetical protein
LIGWFMALLDSSGHRGVGFLWAWVLIVSGLLSFEIGVLKSRADAAAGKTAPPGTSQVQSLVQQATATARREADELLNAARPPQALSFGRLLGQSTYPVFLFEGGQLRQWSAAGPLPTKDELDNPQPEHLARTSLGDFVVVRRADATHVVLVYVPLTQHYGISNRYLREGNGHALLQDLEVQVQASWQRSANASIIREVDGQTLFAVQWLQGGATTGYSLPLVMLAVGGLLYLVGWLALAYYWWRAGRVLVAILTLALPLTALRLALLQLGLP